jgi:hypothetical protein
LILEIYSRLCYTEGTVKQKEFVMYQVKRFNPTMKLRVISNNVSFYTTPKQIRNGVGDFIDFNSAVQKALDTLEYANSNLPGCGRKTSGMCGTWSGIDIQINII